MTAREIAERDDREARRELALRVVGVACWAVAAVLVALGLA